MNHMIRPEKLWAHGNCFGGIVLNRDGEDIAIIAVWPGRPPAYSTALKIARRMVRLLNAGEAALGNSEAPMQRRRRAPLAPAELGPREEP